LTVQLVAVISLMTGGDGGHATAETQWH